MIRVKHATIALLIAVIIPYLPPARARVLLTLWEIAKLRTGPLIISGQRIDNAYASF
jgi:hypothetical protein